MCIIVDKWCVEIIVDFFWWFVLRFLIMVCFVLVFIVDRELFKIRIFGFKIMVWFIVIFCFCLLDNEIFFFLIRVLNFVGICLMLL